VYIRSHIRLGSKAYIVFLTSAEVQIARPYWYVGMIAAVLFACVVFEIIRREYQEDEEQ